MRRDVLELRDFYATPLGAVARRAIARKLDEAWGGAAGCDVLGLGYATPWLDGLPAARRTVAAMPAQQGVEGWPAAGRNRTALVDERALPFATGLFDRVLVAHGLEEADDAAALLREAGRVTAPSGRLVIVAAARGGLWARAEKTPFGHGRPFTRGQLERLVREVELEPFAWSQALYLPPWSSLTGAADGFEQLGPRLLPGAAGVVLLEAVKHTFALRLAPARGRLAPARAGLLAPQPAGLAAPLDDGREPA